MLDSVAPLLAEHAELQVKLSEASLHSNPALAKKLNRRYAELSSIVAAYNGIRHLNDCLLYTSPSPRDGLLSRMPSSA